MTDYSESQTDLHGASILGRIRIVLVEPSHPGNIGSTARAMKVMGLKDLRLVAPKQFPDPEASALASGAEDILESAQVLASLPEAIKDCVRVYGTSARDRHIQWQQLDARAASVDALRVAAHEGPVALLFGRERTGLSNQELDHCQVLVHIPTGPDYTSLNLAQAVQVLAYELQVASRQLQAPDIRTEPPVQATAAEREGLYDQLQALLLANGFLQAPREEHMMRRLRRIYDRANLSRNEVDILRGILTETWRWGHKHSGDA